MPALPTRQKLEKEDVTMKFAKHVFWLAAPVIAGVYLAVSLLIASPRPMFNCTGSCTQGGCGLGTYDNTGDCYCQDPDGQYGKCNASL